jgi:hypothetical protein
MRIAAIFCATALCLSAACSASAVASTPSERRLAFDVYLDGERIGDHLFDLSDEGGKQVVRSQADFEVKVLFFTAFSYEHRNREVWRDGCLQAIDSRTDSNGERYTVNGTSTPTGFEVRTVSGEGRLDACVRTFAYWDRALLDKPRLLNSQTGEHVMVTLRALDGSRLEIDGAQLPVERYALSGDDIEIMLYYSSETGQWVGLDSRLEGGRTLQYRRRGEPLLSAAMGVSQ